MKKGGRQWVKEGAIRREESNEGRSSWSPTLRPLSLSSPRKKSALNVITTLHALPSRLCCFLRTSAIGRYYRARLMVLVRRWLNTTNCEEEEKDRQEEKLWQRRFGVWVAGVKKKKKSPRQLQRHICNVGREEEERRRIIFLCEERIKGGITRKEVSTFTQRRNRLCCACLSTFKV